MHDREKSGSAIASVYIPEHRTWNGPLCHVLGLFAHLYWVGRFCVVE
jgi:hypothetical protein